MEPKDLKNPEGLKSTEKLDTEKLEKKNVSDDVEKTDEPVEAQKLLSESTEKAEQELSQKAKEIEKPLVEEVKNKTDLEKTTEQIEDPKETVEKNVEIAEEPDEVIEKTIAKDEEVIQENIETDVEKPIEVVVEKETKEFNKEEIHQGKDLADKKEDLSDEKIPVAESIKEEEKLKEPVEITQTPKADIHKKEKVDYSKLTQVELINALSDVLDKYDERSIKEEVETIKAVFYRNFNEELEKEKKSFIENGGNEEDFVAETNPYENDIKDLLKRYRSIRIDLNRKLDVEKEENLKLKYEVIEEIKGLINNEESINKTFNDFRELQRKWREIGLVPQSKMKNLWDTYHFHVENFYDYIKINRELRDLDLKKNLEAKITLCERAEELLVESSIIKAFNTLQKYHEQWREIGPVPMDQKDDIWERFKATTAKINKKHQEFFENRKNDQKKNLEAKTALCEKVEEINELEIINHRDWDAKSKELVELQKVWRTIGFAPRKDNNKIYDRFRTACDKFFDAKREFYAKNKELQQNNLQQKIDLCVQAESLKDNTDWRKTTQDFINIQKKWKEVGPIPRKHSDAVWKRFRTACDYFFDKKSEHFSSMDSEQEENLVKKQKLIKEVVNFVPVSDIDENLRLLKLFQRRWTEIGHVPIKSKDELQSNFRDAINKLFDDLKIDESKRNLLKFRSKMNSFSESSRGQNKMRLERDKYAHKLKQLESDLVLLENNIGFFAKSKNADSLIEDVKKKIEVSIEKIKLLKEKIRVIDDMDGANE